LTTEIKGLRIPSEMEAKLQPMKNLFAQAFDLKPEDIVVAGLTFVLVDRNNPGGPEVRVSLDAKGYEDIEAGDLSCRQEVYRHDHP